MNPIWRAFFSDGLKPPTSSWFAIQILEKQQIFGGLIDVYDVFLR